jgi:DNA-directed RNA polymerase subunit L
MMVQDKILVISKINSHYKKILLTLKNNLKKLDKIKTNKFSIKPSINRKTKIKIKTKQLYKRKSMIIINRKSKEIIYL